jgi:FAD/FMN-containing dehydrogenase
MRHFSALILLAAGLLATADIASELGPQLSPNARLVFPSSTEWTDLTARWDPFSTADLVADVEAATASDVQTTVKYAATCGIKLLVRNTAHGFTETIRSVVDGIQLSVSGMNGISLDLERNVATLGGGVIVAEFIQALYKAGKRSATGNCDCVGLAGLGLGGGHGRHQVRNILLC